MIAASYANMNDDFNTPKTIAVLFEMVSKINKMVTNSSIDLSEKVFNELKATFNGFIEDVFGLVSENKNDNGVLDGALELLINMRKEAKQNKDYALSDQIRDKLSELGVQLKDSKEGTTYTIK